MPGRDAPALHEELAGTLSEQVSRMAAGEQLPTETQLMERFQVSRSTIRKAIQHLVDDGLLARRQGKGTFVAARRLVHPLDRLRPFVSIFTAVGQYPEGRVRAYEWVEPSGELPEAMARSGHGALLVKRTYYVDDRPKALAEIFLPDNVGRRLSRAAIEDHPVYQALDELGIVLHHADMIVRSEDASAASARELGIAERSPLLVLERTTYDTGDNIAECARYYLPADAFELRLSVLAHEHEPPSYSFSRSGADLVLVPPKSTTDSS